MDALAKLGVRRRELVAQLAEIEAQIDRNLAKTYVEGWTWEELREASSLSQGPLANRLRKLGLITSSDADTPIARRRSARKHAENAPEVVTQAPAQKQEALCVVDLGAGVPGRFGGLLSWVPAAT